MQQEILSQIDATVKFMWSAGESLVASGANRRALIAHATGCYWGLINMQHAAVFAGDCDAAMLWSDAALWWLSETLGI